jgi:hypothetical protein
MRLVTVMEVCRRIDVEPAPDLCTTIRQRVAHRWKKEKKVDPKRPLQPKTRGGGSHCIASYPEWFVPTIIEEIRKYGAAAAKQASFDFGGAEA